jgi:hypothetical protein
VPVLLGDVLVTEFKLHQSWQVATGREIVKKWAKIYTKKKAKSREHYHNIP